ncbi:hypothetical protein Tco_0417070 [Tanacetum coccineum]
METQKPLLKDKDGEEVDVHMYLKGQPKLDIWYPRYSPFDLVAYTYSDFTRASLDRKSTTGVQETTVVANSITEAEYVAASSCYDNYHVIGSSAVKYNSTVGLYESKKSVKFDDGKAFWNGIGVNAASVRRDLKLEDEEGIDCLPNSTIFEQLALMGKPKRKDTQIPQSSDPSDNVADEAVHNELGDSLVSAATIDSSLEVEQDSGGVPGAKNMGKPIAQE